ncbi:EH signature domain-containing protein [Halobacillus salinus]|nr:EH signature domain-containing protein [Halobacillus salinus]
MKRKELPKLIEEIRKLPYQEPVLKEYAEKLISLEISILSSEYPYELSNEEHFLDKVVIVLTHSYNRIVGSRFWGHLHVIPEDKHVHQMLSVVFKEEDPHFLSLRSDIRKEYNQIFSKPAGDVLRLIAERLGSLPQPLEENFEKWMVQEGSRLERMLWILILGKFMSRKGFLEHQNLKRITEVLDTFNPDTYKKLIIPYLQSNDFQNFKSELMKQLIGRLGDPRETTKKWRSVPGNAVKKVKSWLYKYDLFQFLDSERFKYWEKYVPNIKALNFEQNPPMAAMEFDRFVVLEFGNTGNAAYFYEVEGFNTYILPKFSITNVEGDLKDKEAHFYIHKLSHISNRGRPTWYNTFDDYMEHFMKGDFKYRKSSSGGWRR